MIRPPVNSFGTSTDDGGRFAGAGGKGDSCAGCMAAPPGRMGMASGAGPVAGTLGNAQMASPIGRTQIAGITAGGSGGAESLFTLPIGWTTHKEHTY